MHRASVNRASGNIGNGRRLWHQIFYWLSDEFFAALPRAKIIRPAFMGVAMLRRVRLDHHTAHRIFHPVIVECAVMKMFLRVCGGVCFGHSNLPVGSGTLNVSHTLPGYVLDSYTLWGYVSSMTKPAHAPRLKRLNRIEEQVRGLARMVEDDRYCIDIITQIAAVRAALKSVEQDILKDHIEVAPVLCTKSPFS